MFNAIQQFYKDAIDYNKIKLIKTLKESVEFARIFSKFIFK